MDSEEINSVAICDGSYQYIDWTICIKYHGVGSAFWIEVNWLQSMVRLHYAKL